jgi:hypothetical protein
MTKTRICSQCGQRLTKALEAMHIHQTDIVRGLKLNNEKRQELAPAAVESFNAAQAAWDAYRRHLDGHGLLGLSAKSGHWADVANNLAASSGTDILHMLKELRHVRRSGRKSEMKFCRARVLRRPVPSGGTLLLISPAAEPTACTPLEPCRRACLAG